VERHPELDDEQRHLKWAYDCLDAMRERAAAAVAAGDLSAVAADAEVIRWHLERRLAALSERPPALCFGRIDYASPEGERYRIGRRHVEDPAGEPVVVDWRAAIAAPFYRATGPDPLDLARRLRFLMDGELLTDIFDEDFDNWDPADPRGGGVPDPLLAELERARTGEMRDIVATIQAEQDRVIRAPLEDTLIVQGGPGTGKTAVGLHRAAFLLYEHRLTLERDQLLVVGPNDTFLHYIAQVLPSLGETAVVNRTIVDLTPAGQQVGVVDPPEVAAIKGDRRMADVIRSSILRRVGRVGADLAVTTPFGVARIRRDEVAALAATLVARGVTMNDGRTLLREQLLRAARTNLGRDWSGDTEASFTSMLRGHPDFRAFVDKAWPSMNARTVIRTLLTNREEAEAAAAGILDDAEITLLQTRRRASARTPWSRSDLALLDEAQDAIAGTAVVYGHVVVDEAQDLSAMEFRMVGRRARNRSMSILGDLAQATSPAAQHRWQDVGGHLDGVTLNITELELGYRVPGPVLDVANRLLPAVAPGVTPSRSVRTTGEPPRFLAVDPADLPHAVAAEATTQAERWNLVGLVVPETLLDPVAEALGAAGVDFSDARSDTGLDRPVTLLPPPLAKGLEFDAVVVVEPAAIAAGGPTGLRLLYVALTRAVQRLSVIHAEPLPEPLRA
jgi:DNA helicase IV